MDRTTVMKDSELRAVHLRSGRKFAYSNLVWGGIPPLIFDARSPKLYKQTVTNSASVTVHTTKSDAAVVLDAKATGILLHACREI